MYGDRLRRAQRMLPFSIIQIRHEKRALDVGNQMHAPSSLSSAECDETVAEYMESILGHNSSKMKVQSVSMAKRKRAQVDTDQYSYRSVGRVYGEKNVRMYRMTNAMHSSTINEPVVSMAMISLSWSLSSSDRPGREMLFCSALATRPTSTIARRRAKVTAKRAKVAATRLLRANATNRRGEGRMICCSNVADTYRSQ